jgi:hypothetical protein
MTASGDTAADAMRVLFSRILGTARPGQREHAEAMLTDLLDLATGNLSAGARTAVIQQALESGQPADGGDRDYEVSLDTRIVSARSPEEAVEKVLVEADAETGDRYYQPDPNPWFKVRPAYSRGPWQTVYAAPDPRAGAGEFVTCPAGHTVVVSMRDIHQDCQPS